MKTTTALTALTAAALAATATLALPLAASDNPKSRIQNPKSDRPNILVFLADDLSWTTTTFAAAAHPDFPTPNMRRLAAAGMTFDRAYVTSPTSAPSRASLLTGLYPVRSGGVVNHQYPSLAKKTWPDYFHDLGYEVVAIGKVAHYNQVLHYNFDHSAGYEFASRTCIDDAIEYLKNRQSTARHGNAGVPPANATQSRPIQNRVSSEATGLTSKIQNPKPLCLMVGTHWPHDPWPAQGDIPPKNVTLLPMLIDTPETRDAWSRYAAAVALADRDLGKTYDAALKYLGPDTLVVFSADNGMAMPFHKWNVYNGGLREPLIISWPGRVPPGTRTQALVSWIDILPTLLEAAGADLTNITAPAPGAAAPSDNRKSKIKNPKSLDGRSFLPVLLGKTDTHHDLVYAIHSSAADHEYPMRAVIGPRYKYIRNLAPDTEYHLYLEKQTNPGGALGNYFPSWVAKAKTDPRAAEILARHHRRPPEELYDIEADPHDLRNLAPDPAHATILADYRQKLDTWMAAQGDKGLPTDEHFKKLKQQETAKQRSAKKAGGNKNKKTK